MNLLNSNIKKVLVIIALICLLFLFVFISVLDFKVKDKFNGALWTIPAKVFSRSLDISEGGYLDRNRLMQELELLGYIKDSEIDRAGKYKLSDSSLTLFLRGFDNDVKKQEKGRFIIKFNSSSKVDSIKRSDGISLDLISLEPSAIGGMYPAHMEDRIPLKWEEVPEGLVNILIAVEDGKFFEHNGFSFKSMLRALFKNVAAADVIEGGSTITQQLAKSLFFSSEQTISRKFMELIVAMLIEFHYSKNEIILAYINDVHLSQVGNRSINGFGLASEHFFGTPIGSLEVHQMSLLVGMLKGPSIYNPRRYKERAKKRRDLVLSILAREGVYSSAQIKDFKSKSIDVIAPRYGSKTKHPAFHDLVRLELRDNFVDKDLRINGLQIHTNLDPVIQNISQQNLRSTISRLQSKYKANLEDLQGAVVIVNINNGEIVSFVGSSSQNKLGFNRALNAIRPIGSSMKPVVYLTALKQHGKYRLNSILEDSKFILDLPEGGKWEPGNFDNKYHGSIQLHEALWQSYNIATARLGMELGVSEVLKDLSSLGFKAEQVPLPSHLIGSIEMTPIQVAQIYQTISSEGFHSNLRAVSYVADVNKKLTWINPLNLEQRFRSEDIHLLKFALKQTFVRGTARGYSEKKIKKWNTGGKTGTSNDQRDSWFAGYAGDFIAIIWLGFDDNRKTPLTGRSGALQVWKAIMKDIDPTAQRVAIPQRVKYQWVDLDDGLLSGKQCPNSIFMPFITGFIPEEVSSRSKNCRISNMSYRKEIYQKVKKIAEGLSED